MRSIQQRVVPRGRSDQRTAEHEEAAVPAVGLTRGHPLRRDAMVSCVRVSGSTAGVGGREVGDEERATDGQSRKRRGRDRGIFGGRANLGSAHSVGKLLRQRGCFRLQDTGGINDKNFRKLSPSALSSIWRSQRTATSMRSSSFAVQATYQIRDAAAPPDTRRWRRRNQPRTWSRVLSSFDWPPAPRSIRGSTTMAW